MQPKIACPNCGRQASGAFCIHCGSPVRARCASCGAEGLPNARFCQDCGAKLGAPRETERERALAPPQNPVSFNVKLTLATVVIACAAFAVVFYATSNDGPASPGASEPEATQSPPRTTAGQAVDLSTMTPRQAAERLFNRVMMAKEQGDMAEARNFAPMAIQAYGQLETLDDDARYHLGLIYLVSGETAEARAQFDAIMRSAPDHLLGIMLEHAIAAESGDAYGETTAYQRFLRVYAKENAAPRQEYSEHQRGIEGFRRDAEQAALR